VGKKEPPGDSGASPEYDSKDARAMRSGGKKRSGEPNGSALWDTGAYENLKRKTVG